MWSIIFQFANHLPLGKERKQKEPIKPHVTEGGELAEHFTSNQQKTTTARTELHPNPLHLTVAWNLRITRSMNSSLVATAPSKILLDSSKKHIVYIRLCKLDLKLHYFMHDEHHCISKDGKCSGGKGSPRRWSFHMHKRKCQAHKCQKQHLP